MAGKILICDDEAHIRRLIEQCLEELEEEGVEIFTAADGEEAIGRIEEDRPDMIILDVMMPKINGFDICEKVKTDERLRSAFVMLLTAKGQEYDRLRGEQAGPNRYMTKPFERTELLARIEALLRRGRTSRHEPSEYAFGDVIVRPLSGTVLRAGRPVRLSAQELKLLVYFVRHPGVLYSRDQLLDAVWGYQTMPETRTVDVHVSWLRQKLEPDPHHPRYIVTVFGLGYRFEADAADTGR